MKSRNEFNVDTDKLIDDLGRIDEISDRVRIAGYGLAAPLLDVRAAQMRREISRVVARKGADHPEVAARQAALARAESRIALARTELDRARLDRGSVRSADGAALWGRVVRNGKPVEGLTVVVTTGGKRVDFRCTNALGGFAMETPSAVPLVISVRARDGAELHRDAESVVLNPGQHQYREIDLARTAEPPCPEPPAEHDAPQDNRFPMVNLVGQREAAALALLNAQGLTLTSRKEEYVKDRAGWVLSQKPEAGAPVRRGDGVSLVVGASGMVRVPAVIGLSLDDARKVLKKAGLAAGRITRVTVAHEKAGLVLEQKPDAGADLDRGATVALSVGARDDDSQSDGSGGSGDHKILVRIARQAEEKLREAGIGDTAPKDYVAVRLKEAGVKDRAALDRFVSLDRTKVRDFLGMRTLAETDRIIAALRKARGEIDD